MYSVWLSDDGPCMVHGLIELCGGSYYVPGTSRVNKVNFDPATFATDLGILVIQGFGDMKEQARDTMIRDKFIASQGQ